MTARRCIRLVLATARALATLAVAEVLLRVTDLPTTCRALRIALDVSSAAPARTATVVLPAGSRRAIRVAGAVVARWPFGDTCLRRCLLLGHLLRRMRPVLRIGVQRSEGTFAAHAWLEVGGSAFDVSAVEYAALGTAEGRA